MSKRVLIIEECAIARSALGIMLQRDGWEVIGAADGAEALRLASSWHFDLVITAPEPSKVPGAQLLRLLRGGLLTSKVRVLLQVDHRDEVKEIPLLSLVDDVLVRDGQIERQLHGKLNRWFNRSRRTARAARTRAKQQKTAFIQLPCPSERVN
jgi:DNA-binding response OmpR family regulator